MLGDKHDLTRKLRYWNLMEEYPLVLDNVKGLPI